MQRTNAAITTGKLMNRLAKAAAFDRFMASYADEMKLPTLTDYLHRLCNEQGKTHEEVIDRACINRVYGHQIFCGMRRPSRDKLVQLAFGFGMRVDQAQLLLKIARQSSTLYPRLERDAVILFCLNKGKSVVDTQLMLAKRGLATLGKESAHE